MNKDGHTANRDIHSPVGNQQQQNGSPLTKWRNLQVESVSGSLESGHQHRVETSYRVESSTQQISVQWAVDGEGSDNVIDTRTESRGKYGGCKSLHVQLEVVLKEGGWEGSVEAGDWGEWDVEDVGALLCLRLKPRSAGRIGFSFLIRIDLEMK